MRKVVISGGNGFIGSSLCQRLSREGVAVHALVNENHQRLDAILPQKNIHVLDQGASSAVATIVQLQPDAIFHLAAVYAEPVSPQCVLSMVNGNVTLGASLLFAATQCASRPVFVNTGTYWQFNQASAYEPNTLYAATKHAFQDILHFYRSRALVRSTTLILYDTFGKEDTRSKLWQQLLTARQGSTFRLSSGEQTIHLVHIDDVVEAFVQATNLLYAGVPLRDVYSVHSDRPRVLRSLVEEINRTADLQLDLRWGAAPYWEGQVMQPWQGEWLPGWTPRTDVPAALIELAREQRSMLAEVGNA